jgi:kynurenine 3-monooxygenase
MAKPAVTIVGAGLVGALLATLLAQRGFAVTVFERRHDPRIAGYAGGRSINLALAERGLHGLRLAGMTDTVMELAVMMRGRMVHHRDGHTELLRYGRDDSEVIWSVSRGRLNTALIEAAEVAGARFEFDRRLDGAQFGADVFLRFQNEAGDAHEAHAPFVIGADGAGSALRAAMNAMRPLGERIEPLGHGYKELEIPPLPDFPSATIPPAAAAALARGEPFAIEANALHIWPRGNYMCIALPNAEGSFTVTLFLPNEGDPSFATVDSPAAARKLFEREFADALPLIPDLEEDFAANPVGMLATLYLDRWHLDGAALLVGDAAHAIVPFHGQGMNCGFEDTVVLADLLAGSDSQEAFVEFQRIRQPNADAIATMALENYVEMRDSVADPRYLAKRELGARLAAQAPQHFMARYRMVTFTHLPYAYALERGRAQDVLLEQLLPDGNDPATVDLDAAVVTLKSTLPPLPPLRHG